MGMLATIINSLALQSALEDNGVKAKVLTSIRMEPIGEYYSKARAIEYLEAGYVVIIGGGTSNPISRPTRLRRCAASKSRRT